MSKPVYTTFQDLKFNIKPPVSKLCIYYRKKKFLENSKRTKIIIHQDDKIMSNNIYYLDKNEIENINVSSFEAFMFNLFLETYDK